MCGVCVYVRELVQLAALLLVGGLELLVLHPQPLLLQHDLLVQTGQHTHTYISDHAALCDRISMMVTPAGLCYCVFKIGRASCRERV